MSLSQYDDFDQHGQLALPLLFWLVMLYQARAWLVFIMAAVSHQSEPLLTLFISERSALYAGLLFGLPALLTLLFSGYRHRFPRVWASWRYLLWLSGAGIVVWQLSQWNQAAFEASPTLLLFTLFDLLTEGWLVVNRRLAHCFAND